MKPRILMLMEQTEQALLSTLRKPGSHYSFVKYPGMPTRKSARDYLKRHKRDLDAVLVMSNYGRDTLIAAAEGYFDGHRILWCTAGNCYVPPSGTYLFQVGPRASPSEFDRLVTEHFAKH